MSDVDHPNSDPRCDPGWHSHLIATQCFRSFHQPNGSFTWYKAEVECQKHGGHLASFHNVAEYTIATWDVEPDGAKVWVGLHSPKSADEYEWVDDSSFNPKETDFQGNVGFGLPKNASTNSGIYKVVGGSGYKVQDKNEGLAAYTCSKKFNNVTLPTPPSPSTTTTLW